VTIAKAIVVTLVAAGAAVYQALQGDDTISVQDGFVIALAILGSGGIVWYVSKAQAAKAFVGGLGVALGSLSLAISGDTVVTNAEWIGAAVAGLVAFQAVYWTPNEELPPDGGNPPSDIA
jgi:hypothetical protein